MSSEILTFEYIGQRFTQRANSEQQLLLFIAPAGDIRSWAGVPRKAFDYQHGFQRTLNDSRVDDIAEYFAQDSKTVSPTSVVVAFTGIGSEVELQPLDVNGSLSDLVKISIRVPNGDDEDIKTLIERSVIELEKRLAPDVVHEIGASHEAALAAAMVTEELESIDEAFGIEGENIASIQDDLQPVGRSYLADFYAQLLGFLQDPTLISEEEKLREVLYSVLRPGMIVDGQHRVFGAAEADESILLAVCALLDSDWVESVYQFVVINQKAKPIKPAFLSSIIATSLSDEEIESVYDRLEVSNINVEKAQIMHRVDTDRESPFRHLIDFEVEGSEGFLQFPGMNTLVNSLINIPRTHAILLPKGTWNDINESLSHFYALWDGIRSYFATADARLWQQPTEDNPNNLMKIVTLQEIQGLMLDNWADARTFHFDEVEKTRLAAHQFWMGFPASFFTDEWKQKGLQTTVGRQILRNAMTETRRNIGRSGWGHRRLLLFRD